MGTGYPLAAPAEPGSGAGWALLAQAVAGQLPAGELDGLWVFRPFRRDGKEYGTAILSRVEDGRLRIYTARYAHTLKGKKRGEFASELAEVGSGPLEALDELVALVPKRTEEEPPLRIPLARWYPAEPDGTPDLG
ncbi:MAG TPA: hypothetical protein PK948_09430 [Gemmatimonadales bacterium]|nr:hypothetical protein [Gemmatimonadales bacterium]